MPSSRWSRWAFGGLLLVAAAVALILGIIAISTPREACDTPAPIVVPTPIPAPEPVIVSVPTPCDPIIKTVTVQSPPVVQTQTVVQDSSDPCQGTWPTNVLTVDYLIVGGGPAGLANADDLSRGLRATGVSASQMSVAVIEKRAVFGGNLRRINLKTPTGYSKTSPTGYGELYGDVGGQRVNVLTLTEERRRFLDLNITMYCSPFRNVINTRDRRHVCRDPYNQSIDYAPYYDCTSTVIGNETQVNCSPDPADAFAYGDFCTYLDKFSSPVSGAYRGARVTGANYSGCANYDNTDDNTCSNWPNNDPSYDAYTWLLQGQTAPQADMRMSGATGPDYDFGSGYNHPLDPARSCSTTASSSNPNACPQQRCLKYADWRSYVAGELNPSLNAAAPTYNDGYANFMQGDNVGFYGDYEQGFGACSYINYQAREWNTASHSCYPKGGMTSLTDGMKARAEANGVKFYANEPATCIKRSSQSGIVYEVRTPSYTIRVKKFMFLAAPTPSMADAKQVGGDVMASLRNYREFNRARGQRVASVVMQWQPGTKAWWFDTGLFDQTSGNWSVRTYGDSACFSRIEIIDTPQHRCTNAIRAIYSDFKCRAMWTDLIEKAAATGNWAKVQERVLVELRDAFPEMNGTIPAPVLTHGEMIEPAWYWAKPEYDDISNEAHAIWAAKPLGTNEPLCLTSESVHIYYQGWTEGALRSSRQCLESRFGTPLNAKLAAVFAGRDNSVPGNGWWSSSNFQDVPAAIGQKHFANEQWWPWDYSGVGVGQYCNASLVTAAAYPVVVASN